MHILHNTGPYGLMTCNLAKFQLKEFNVFHVAGLVGNTAFCVDVTLSNTSLREMRIDN